MLPRQSVNFYLFSSDFCCLLLTFANILDPDQDRHNVGPDLDPNRLTLKEYSEKVTFENKSADDKNHEKIASMQRINFIKHKLVICCGCSV